MHDKCPIKIFLYCVGVSISESKSDSRSWVNRRFKAELCKNKNTRYKMYLVINEQSNEVQVVG